MACPPKHTHTLKQTHRSVSRQSTKNETYIQSHAHTTAKTHRKEGHFHVMM